MRLLKYPFLNHKDATSGRKHEIYSLDVSIQGKLATGAIDGRVCIWDTNGLKTNDTISMTEVPLCSMTRHDGAITCVRFSPNGRFLASGSDDKLVLIWELDEEKSRVMKSNRKAMESMEGDSLAGDLEHWTARKRLVAHDNDVQDMAWAPDGSILVSVGLDRSIVVWSGTTFEKIKRFDIHQSHVKGVTFDPAGKYFVTCSDDRTMRVFHYSKGISDTEMSFTIEAIVRQPFDKSPLSTYFRRCSWSPDGLYIAAPNGMNDGINANPIIKRGTWDREVSLIGHRLPSEVCSFSPRLYEVSDGRVDTILISAGQDRTAAIWSTNCSTPLCVITEVSMKSITDISWSSNGLEVYLCSLDGDVVVIGFDDFELGRILPWEETLEALNKYGKDRDVKFTESVTMLELEQLAQRKFPHLMEIESVNSSRLNDLMKGSSEGLQSSSQAPVESVNLLVGRSKKNPNKKMPVIQTLSTTATTATIPLKKTDQPDNNTLINTLTPKSQKVTITKSGKKRVAPMLISTSTTTEKSTSTPVTKKTNTNKLSYISHPTTNLPKNGLPTLVYGLLQIPQDEVDPNEEEEDIIDDIVEAADTNSNSNNGIGSKKRQRKNYNRNNENKKMKFDGKVPYWIENDVINPMTMFNEKNECDVQVEVKESKENEDEQQTLEIRYMNETNRDKEFDDPFEEEFNTISQIISRDSKDNGNNWDYFINDKLTSIDESNWSEIEYWVLGFDSGKIFILSVNGRLICPIITLGSPIIKLIAKNDELCAITLKGEVWSWKLFNLNGERFINKIDGVSLAPLLNQYSNDKDRKKVETKVQIRSIKFNDGLLFIVLSNDDTFTWDMKLECWLKVIDKYEFTKSIDEGLNPIELLSKLTKKSHGLSSIIRSLITRGKYNRESSIPTVSNKESSKIQLSNWSNQIECIYNHL